MGRAWGPRSALEGLSLRIEAGERVALVGPSGAGKTTLLRLLAGSLAASSGDVRAAGEDLCDLTPRALRAYRARCGIVPQSQALVRTLSVHRNVLAGLLPEWPWYRVLASLLVRSEEARVRAVLDRVGIGDRQWDPVSVLSGGQEQRVAVARAIVREPGIILADEPTASLDPTNAVGIVELLAGLARERAATLVISTHHLDRVVGSVDRVIGLRRGRIVLDVPSEEAGGDALDALYDGDRPA